MILGMILVDDRANSSRTALDFAELSIQFYLEMCIGSHTGKTTCWMLCDRDVSEDRDLRNTHGS